MSPLERWSLRVGALLGVCTGVGLGLTRYLGGVEGEFGPEPSPHLPLWQHAHVVVVPLLVFALGAAVGGHAKSVLDGRFRSGRRSGLALGLVAVPLVLGGYAIQVLTSVDLRAWVGWIHAGVGVIFALAYLLHWTKRLTLPALSKRVQELGLGSSSHPLERTSL